MRILIVEDSEVIRELLGGLLADYGSVDAAESAEEALDLFRAAREEDEPFELIFMDIMLPGKSGLQAIEEIRAEEDCLLNSAQPCQVKIVVVSALDDDVSARRAFFQGHALSYLTKPFSADDIRGEMAKLGF